MISPSAVIHSTARSEAAVVGPDTVIGAEAHLGPAVTVGSRCVLEEGTQLHGEVRLGNRVYLGRGVQILGPAVIGDDVRIGDGVVIRESPSGTPTVLGSGSIIGARAAVSGGVSVGEQALVDDGTTVSSPVADYARVGGPEGIEQPRAGVVPTGSRLGRSVSVGEMGAGDIGVGHTRLVSLVDAVDSRGKLVAAEAAKHVPFTLQRFFTVSAVPPGERRGIHAHFACHQFLLAVNGSVHCTVADGESVRDIVLDVPSVALHMPPLTWGTQHSFSPDAVLLVIASHAYDPDDYIHHWDRFIKEVARS